MEEQADIRQRCADAVSRLDCERGWGLSQARRDAYVAGVMPHVGQGCDDAALGAKIAHYHLDHWLVDALRDERHPQHADAWAEWVELTLRIVRSRYPDALDAAVAEAPDLAQDGLAALCQALPSFHYNSRFSTWAYAVVLRIAHRRVRDLGAAKRTAQLESVELEAERGTLLATAGAVEDRALAHLLAETIGAILRTQPDDRLALIFQLWAIDDQQLAAIGKRLHLSASRVNALLSQTRALLREHPQIAGWRADRGGESSPDAAP